MQYIDEAFQQIKEVTGVTDVDEIVTTFIKSEEQNQSLINYASLLTQDIDTFEELNKDLAREIDELDTLKKKRVAAIEGNEQEKEKKRIKALVDSKRREISALRLQYEGIQLYVEPLLVAFSNSPIHTHVLGRYNYDAGVALNDNNVEQFLAEFDDYLDTFILYHKKANESPAAPYIPKPGMWEEQGSFEADTTKNQVKFPFCTILKPCSLICH